MTRKDKLTGEAFEAKRVSQFFANSKNRIAWHNRKANNLRHATAFINKPLHCNVMILNDLMADQSELVVHKQFLSGKNFSFGVHSHLEVYNETNHFAIYHYIIVPVGNDHIKIVKK